METTGVAEFREAFLHTLEKAPAHAHAAQQGRGIEGDQFELAARPAPAQGESYGIVCGAAAVCCRWAFLVMEARGHRHQGLAVGFAQEEAAGGEGEGLAGAQPRGGVRVAVGVVGIDGFDGQHGASIARTRGGCHLRKCAVSIAEKYFP